MDRKTTTEWMRLLHGELSETDARQVRDRLRQEPELQRRFEVLEALWHGLELPDSAPAPPGFANRVLARAREKTDQGLVPPWWSHTMAGRVTTALLLAGGIAFGAILATPGEQEDWSGYLESEPSMAESYLSAMEPSENDLWQENGS